MAMTPQEQERMDKLEKLVMSLLRVENVEFIANIRRRIVNEAVVDQIALTNIEDLNNVDITSVSSGEVLKYTTTGVDRWINGTDNI